MFSDPAERASVGGEVPSKQYQDREDADGEEGTRRGTGGVSNQTARQQEERIRGLVAELEVTKAEVEAEKKRSTELEKQRQDAEAKLQSEIDKAYSEGAAFASTSYDAQVLEVRDEVWELGWRAALTEVGVSEDHPAYMNPAKFPEPESSPAISPSAEVAATEDIPPSANDDVPADV